MGPTQSLLRVELPLAAPAIIAGLRIATVTVISLATVASLIDNEGLGVPILTAISNEVFKTELIAAGAMAVGLALVADGLLVLAQRFLTPWARAALMQSFIEAFKFIGRNGQVPGEPPLPTLVHLTLETLKIAGIGIAISVAIALPLGLWLGHIHKGSFVAINLGNIWRALPSLAVLAIGVAFLGIGLRNVELALVVLAIPPIITNAYVAIDGVDRDVVDAARGMGLTGLGGAAQGGAAAGRSR